MHGLLGQAGQVPRRQTADQHDQTGPADPKAGRTRTALAHGSSRPSRPALQPTSASRAFALTTGPEKESTSSAEVPPPRNAAFVQVDQCIDLFTMSRRGLGAPHVSHETAPS